MVKIKFCGMTNRRDVERAVKLGVDAIGFIFAKSPRRVTVARASSLVKELPPFMSRVGVFVNEKRSRVEAVRRKLNLDTLQFHGEEPPAYCSYFRRRAKVLKAFRMRNGNSLKQLHRYEVDGYLLDTYHPTLKGGTGRRFPVELARRARKIREPIILSGGLTPHNVALVVRDIGPYGVDVSSGIESRPGKKSFRLMKQFVSAVRKGVRK